MSTRARSARLRISGMAVGDLLSSGLVKVVDDVTSRNGKEKFFSFPFSSFMLFAKTIEEAAETMEQLEEEKDPRLERLKDDEPIPLDPRDDTMNAPNLSYRAAMVSATPVHRRRSRSRTRSTDDDPATDRIRSPSPSALKLGQPQQPDPVQLGQTSPV
ncbi:hypothetical protein Tsubulata_020800, partial [Turnera subulata]